MPWYRHGWAALVTAQWALGPSSKAVRLLDAIAIVLVAAFVTLGVLAGVEMARLAGFNSSLANAANALDQVGGSLATLARLPFVGQNIGTLANSVHKTAASIRVDAANAVAGVHTLAVVVGLSIAAVPLAPLLTIYLPLRLIRFSQLRRLRRLLAAGSVDPPLLAHLAHGAVSRLPYTRLRQISDDPWSDLVAGRHQELAAAELRRLGIALPKNWRTTRPKAVRGSDR
jgi:hypothetical protein